MSGFKNCFIEYENRYYFINLFNDRNIDSCVTQYSVMSKEFLFELKEKMMFAMVFNNHIDVNPKVTIYYKRKEYENFDSYSGLELESQATLPIYCKGECSTGDTYIKDLITSKKVYLTSDFNEVIKILNINDYDYYKEVFTNENI